MDEAWPVPVARQFFLPHRAAAAFRAISALSALVRAFARAAPPARPPCRANSSRSSAVRRPIDALPPLRPKATACGFFRTDIAKSITHTLSESGDGAFEFNLCLT